MTSILPVYYYYYYYFIIIIIKNTTTSTATTTAATTTTITTTTTCQAYKVQCFFLSASCLPVCSSPKVICCLEISSTFQ